MNLIFWLGLIVLVIGLIGLILSGRATIGTAALLGDIPPKNRLYWIKPLLILLLFIFAGTFVFTAVLGLVIKTEEVVGVLSDIIMFFPFVWLAYQGSKNEVKEKMKEAGFSYNKTNWGLVGVNFIIYCLLAVLFFPFLAS